ncbi:MAG: hypothetical protein C0410_06645 [Anaerolinea sp.]|nr:hypothetical protein [Anaerolinea sp.]
MHTLKVNVERMKKDFESLSQIGSTGNGGINRPSLSENHLLAREWFRKKVTGDGFEFYMDNAGNHFARLLKDPQAPSLLMGSHLDSVPQGGRFDGALGVVAAYEALRSIRDNRVDIPFNIEVVDFTDEEGTLVGMLGSRALSGTLPLEDLTNPRGGRHLLEESLTRAGLNENSILSARKNPGSLLAYIELHIEQGPRIRNAKADIGIVTAFVGIRSFTLKYVGRADHAGTTPMDARLDAGLGLSAFMLAAHKEVLDGFPDCVINFGQVTYSPGAYNIVPGSAEAMLEFRAPNNKLLDRLERVLLDLAKKIGKTYGLDFTYLRYGRFAPTPCSKNIQDLFALVCNALGLRYVHLTSGAGHDAMSLANICPVGMIFIPSSGSSHSPTEFALWDDCVNGANALLNSVINLKDIIGSKVNAHI